MVEKKKDEKKQESRFFNLYDEAKCKSMFRGAKLMSSSKDDESSSVSPEHSVDIEELKNLQVSDSKQCSYCRVTFATVEDQRSHYKLDWHRYNLKLSIENREPVQESDFTRLVEELEQKEDGNLSISGSDTEEEDEEEFHEFQRNPKFYLKNADGLYLSIYKTILVDPKLKTLPGDLDLTKALDGLSMKWAIFMLGGGHFAGAVFSDNQAVVHKTFHCYTVRAKQGGSQGSADNKAGSTHKSAGASLRRYNEMALIQHVQDITKLWSSELAGCSLIFYRAASSNRSVLFGGKTPALSRNDPRLRTIPFQTKRATFSELKRVHESLSRVEIIRDLALLSQQTNKNVKKSRTIQRSKSREAPTRPLPGLPDTAAEGKGGDSSDSETELEFSQEVHSTRELMEFDQSPSKKKPRRRKGNQKTDTTGGLTDAVSEEDRLNLALQNRFLTAVRSGNLKELDACVQQVEDETNNQQIEEASSNQQQETGSSLKTEDKNIQNDSVQNDQDSKAKPKTDRKNRLENMLNEQFGEGKMTFLHLAAQSDHRQIVGRLLELGSDPCVRDKLKRVPYSLAKDKETRNTFRRSQALFPTRYDWKGAQVPPPLTPQEEEERDKKINEKKKAKRLAQKEKDKLVKQEEKIKQEQLKEKERFLQMSDREKRALAAERRFLANSSSNVVLTRCFLCAKDITGKVPFSYNENIFCSPGCVKKHRDQNK